MSQQMIIPAGELPAHLQKFQQNPDMMPGTLAAGIQSSFPSISIRGKVWRIKAHGEEHPVIDPATGMAMQYLDVVIVAANDQLSKTFYRASYQEGSDAAPDCGSSNGITPDAGVPLKQAEYCASCPQNVWGSAISQTTGKPVKACQDSKRLAVVAVGPQGVTFGTSYLLSVPAASLKKLVEFASKLKQVGRPFNAVVTRLTFDMEAAYPLLDFGYVRDLTAEEFAATEQEATLPIIDSIIGKVAHGEVSVSAPGPAVAPEPVQQVATQTPPVQTAAAPAMAQTAPAQNAAALVATQAAPVGFGVPAQEAPQPVQPVQQTAPPALQAAPAQNAAAPVATQAAPVGFGVPVQETPQPVQPVQQAAPAQNTEVDVDGVPWNEAIHSSGRTKNADGRWKKKRGATKDTPVEAAPAQTAPAGFGASPVQAPQVETPAVETATPAVEDELSNILASLGG